MTIAAKAFVAAVVVGGLAFASPPAIPAIAVVAAAASGLAIGLAVGRPRRWSLRLAYGLLFAYLVVWSWFHIRTWRLERGDARAIASLERAEAERVATWIGDRLAADRALAERAAARLAAGESSERLEALDDASLFVALGRAVPEPLPGGVGIELHDRTGALRAWWGDPRGERLPTDSIPAALRGATLYRPAGYTLAYSAVPLTLAGERFFLAVKDVWSVDSPLVRGASNLFLQDLERAARLSFAVVPAREGALPGAGRPVREATRGEPAAIVVSEGFRLEAYLEELRREGHRILAVLYLWPLLWAAAALWQVARGRAQTPSRERPGWRGWAIAMAGQTALLVLLWAFFMESDYLALLLPASWFSPIPFAFGLFGPGGRSPGDFVTTAGLLALLAISIYTLLPEPPRRRWWRRAGLAAVAAVGIAWLMVGPATASLEAAMQNMSPSVFFSATLLFSPPFLMVLLGFALLAVVPISVLAIGLRASEAPAGPGWLAAALAIVAASLLAAAWTLPGAALGGRMALVALFLAIGTVATAWVARAAARPPGARPGFSGVRFGLVAGGLGALLILPLAAYARVQAAHELLVERAERIGEASTQWLQYTMSRTAEFLAANPDVAGAIAGGSRDAALLLWSQSPLRTLDFASGLYIFDTRGTIVSQFALTPVDLSGRARQHARNAEGAGLVVEGSREEGGIWWAVVPIRAADSLVGTAVAMTTDAVELREPTPGSAFVLTDLLSGSGLPPDLPGYTTLGEEEEPPPRTLITTVHRAGGDRVQLAMPLDPLLPDSRGYAVFGIVGAIGGLLLGLAERLGDVRARKGWWSSLRTRNPLRSFRVQLLLAFVAVAALPLALYAVLSFRAARLELEEAARAAAAEALGAASRMLVGDPALAEGTTRVLSGRLREIAVVLQQDLILYWRGRTIASSRPEIFASRLFADRMEGEVYTDLFAVREPIVFDPLTVGGRSFVVAYRPLFDPGAPSGYVLATPLLIREDRARVDLQRLGETVFLLSAFSLGFLLIVGWGLARYMARPLSALEMGTRQIAAGRFSYRLPVPARRDEFGRLQRSFNAMATRLATGQRALEREKSRVQAILASVGAGVVAVDEAGRVRLLNERAATLLGQNADEVLNRPVAEVAAAGGPAEAFWGQVARVMGGNQRPAGAPPVERDLVLRRDGEERHYTVVCTELRDGAGEERGLVVAFEDITPNVQSQRVLAWGEMARQVAHEIKNPLTPMKLSLQHLERAAEDGADDFPQIFRSNVDLVLSEIERLEKIAGNFARFAVPDPAVRESFDAPAVAREVLALYDQGQEPIAYSLELVGDPQPILGDPESFRRILVNLVQNSREAVIAAGAGSVVLRLDWQREPGWARISVVDDGVGLPEQGLERLFEPSFSSKTRGTGLGLAITRRIVEAWGGTIGYERLTEGGTAIHVRLPSNRIQPNPSPA